MVNFKTPLPQKVHNELNNGLRSSCGLLWTCRHGVGIATIIESPTHWQNSRVHVVQCVIMPQLPLRRRLLDELDDVDHSFKCARLSKYLQDMTIEAFIPLSASESGSDVSISSISSVSSVSSSDSDDGLSFQLSLSDDFSDIEEMYYLVTQAKIDGLRREIATSRVLRKNSTVKKASQLHLLDHWRTGNLGQYRRRVRVDPDTFNSIVNKIRDHNIFHNNSNIPQALVEVQVTIFLFRAGHYGNAATVDVAKFIY